MGFSSLVTGTPPETSVLSSNQYDLIFYAVVITAFALLASFLHSVCTKSEVSVRYRPAVLASMCITAIATLSYTVILLKVDTGYNFVGGRYVPNPEALFSISPRYFDWTVTVPLLTIELLAVTTLAGKKLSTLRASTIAASFLMIITGYLGSQVFANGGSTGWLWLWWAISMVFFIYLYIALVPAVLKSAKELPEVTGKTLVLAMTVLLSTFVVYPIVYLVPIFFHGGWWTTGIQLAFSAADITAKVGFGTLIHKVAKMRTAADMTEGMQGPDEPIWVNDELLSPQPAIEHAAAFAGATASYQDEQDERNDGASAEAGVKHRMRRGR